MKDIRNVPMEFVLLTEELAHAVAPWFDDADTIRYLGNRSWLYRELRLMQTAPGSTFRGRRVLAPDRRGHGLRGHTLCLLETRPELQGIREMIGGIEPENISAKRSLERAGYTFDSIPDEEGFLRFDRRF